MESTPDIPATNAVSANLGSTRGMVVFIHGEMDSRRVWEPLLTELSAGDLDVDTLDLPGSGDRKAERAATSFESCAAEVLRLVDRSAKPFVVVGHGLGSKLAEIVASRRRYLAASLVLLAPLALQGELRHYSEIAQLLDRLSAGSMALRQHRRELAPTMAAVALEALDKLGNGMSQQTLSQLITMANTGHASGIFGSRFHGQALLVTGSLDPRAGQRELTAIAGRFPDARTEILEGVGHWPHFEAPKEVASLITRYLEHAAWSVEATKARPYPA